MVPNPLYVKLPLKVFLQIEHCPPEWGRLNLYRIGDEELIFYVGQSYVAFHRVWEHFYAGFKGRSLLGRFIICNWPASMRFTVELLSSGDPRFDAVENDLDRCEQLLIQQHAPCLNTAYNPHPTHLPGKYASPYTSLKFRYHPQRLIHQAAQAIQASTKKAWIKQAQD